MINKNGYTKEEFLQLKITSCPFCESADIVQWYGERTKHLACLNCDYYLEEQFVYINWIPEELTDED